MSYASKSHIQAPYGGFYLGPEMSRKRDFKPIGNFVKEDVISSKTRKAAVWFVSNCASTERLNVTNALKR